MPKIKGLTVSIIAASAVIIGSLITARGCNHPVNPPNPAVVQTTTQKSDSGANNNAGGDIQQPKGNSYHADHDINIYGDTTKKQDKPKISGRKISPNKDKESIKTGDQYNVSNNAPGGVAIGKVENLVVNPPAQQRHMDQKLKDHILTDYPDKDKAISVSIVMNDREADIFGHEIASYLDAQGFTKVGITYITLDADGLGLSWDPNAGNEIMVGHKRD